MADEDAKKIIVDEDWKAQVQREREEARNKADEEPAADEEKTPGRTEGASFVNLVTDLATQTLFALGFIAPQGTKEVMVDIAQAKYLIDTLMVLRDKTKDNLAPEEEGHLREALGELQRAYVARAQQVQEAELKNAGVDPKAPLK